MPDKPYTIPQPLDGIVRRLSHDTYKPNFCPGSLNILDQDWSVAKDGRERITTRPGVTNTSIDLGTPYNWAETSFVNTGVTYRGISVISSTGVRVLYVDSGAVAVFGGGDFITDDPGTDFASTATYDQTLFLARGGGTTLYRALTGVAGIGTALGSHPDVEETPPTNCGIVCAHGDRLWLAGDTANPHVLYCSAVQLFYDWDTAGGNGDGNSWASTDVEGGRIGEPITALASHSRDCLVVFCVDSTYTVIGNPRTGEVRRLSTQVGALMQSAWCHDSNNNLWFVSRDGVYKLSGSCGDGVTSISRESLPDDLSFINPAINSGTYVSLSFDAKHRLLWLFVDRTGTDNDVAWSYDLQRPHGSWRKHSFTTGPMRLGATLKAASTDALSASLAIDDDGNIHQFDSASTESFSSYCIYDPIPLGGSGAEGIIFSVQASIAANSSPVSMTLHLGGTAEESVVNAEADTARYTFGDWVAGLNHWQNCNRRAAYACIKISGTTTDRYSIERFDAQLEHSIGLRRVG